MEKAIEAKYQDGVFKPKTPVDLEDNADVLLIIESKPKIYDDEEDPSGYKTVRSFIGFIKTTPEDVPIARDHDKYLDE